MEREVGRRIALVCSYDGRAFSGFQYQRNARSIQGELERALRTICKREVKIHGCSRTDAGVHAAAHVSHFDCPLSIPAEKIPLALNSLLPPEISVLQAADMPADFHARFNSKGKRYSYRMQIGRRPHALLRPYVSFVPSPCDRIELARCVEAFPYLLGLRDFKAFQAAGSDLKGSTVRRLDEIQMSLRPIPTDGFSFAGSASSPFDREEGDDGGGAGRGVFCGVQWRPKDEGGIVAGTEKGTRERVAPAAGDDGAAVAVPDAECLSFRRGDAALLQAGALDGTPLWELCFEVHGDGFLYNMVRILAGSLLYLAEGRLSLDELRLALTKKERTKLGKTMPPEGLCLLRVDYEERYERLLFPERKPRSGRRNTEGGEPEGGGAASR